MENLTYIEIAKITWVVITFLGLSLVALWTAVCTILFCIGKLDEDTIELLFKVFALGAGMCVVAALTYPIINGLATVLQ